MTCTLCFFISSIFYFYLTFQNTYGLFELAYAINNYGYHSSTLMPTFVINVFSIDGFTEKQLSECE